MKTLSIAVSSLCAALALGVTACGGEKGGENDSLKNVKGAQQGEAFNSTTNIRYIDMDTIAAHYQLAKDQSAKAEKIAIELQQYQNQLARNLQTKGAAIQQKAQNNGYLSEASYNADMQELQRLDQASSAQYAKRAEADNARIAELQQAYVDSVQNFIVRYNKEYKYDAILFKSAGLYFNPALDITNDVLKGLNAAYSAQKSEAKAEADKK